MKKILIFILPLFFFTACFTSCKKDAGTGGSSSLTGKVMVHDYNSTFTILEDEYYGQEVDVYIIYGDSKTYSDHIKTNYDGTFEFKYLQKGTYHVLSLIHI